MTAVDPRAARATPTGKNRVQQALHEGEERSDPGARGGHQSAASYPADQIRDREGFHPGGTGRLTSTGPARRRGRGPGRHATGVAHRARVPVARNQLKRRMWTFSTSPMPMKLAIVAEPP